MNTTPLRYPGGKSVMTPFFEKIIEVNSMKNVVYAEPYAGGAGAAINLLLKGTVESIQINDANIGVYSFWHYLTTEGDLFLKILKGTKVTLDEWQKQRKIYKTSTDPSLELGFATFFLSRSNRSGILNAGPMGGQDPQKQFKAKYKLDCRYNKASLIQKIESIIEKRGKILVYNDDAISFLKKIKNENTFVYLDPPYYEQGSSLYMNYYKERNHVELASFLKTPQKFKWILSYDSVQQILDLYSDFNLYQFNIYYTAQDIKKGDELLIHSKDLILPFPLKIKRNSNDIVITSIKNQRKKMKHQIVHPHMLKVASS